MFGNYLSPSDRNGKITKWLTIIGIILALLLLFNACCSYKEKTETKKDTVLVSSGRDTVIFKTNPELQYKSFGTDTVIKPYSFMIDTLVITKTNNRIKHDTLKIGYNFPENLLNFSYLPEPDSLFKETETRTITKIVELTVWDYLKIMLPTALLFLVFGFLIGKFG